MDSKVSSNHRYHSELSMLWPEHHILNWVTYIIEPQNHRMAWVEKDVKDHLVSTSCHTQGCQTLDQAAQSHIFHGPLCYSAAVDTHDVEALESSRFLWRYLVTVFSWQEKSSTMHPRYCAAIRQEGAADTSEIYSDAF